MQPKYEFNDETEIRTTLPPDRNWPEIFVRSIGMLLLLIGLWAGTHVILESLSLYRDPVRIEQLAQAIERGSQIDKSLSEGINSAQSSQSESGIRLSYFVAWVVALMLLLLISMMAFSCIRAGSELVLQDKNLKRYLDMTAKHSLIKAPSA